MKVLLLTAAFPPVIGGSAVVMESLCRNLRCGVCVVAPRRDFVSGDETPGWREADEGQPFAVERVELLRPPRRPAPSIPVVGSALRYLAEELPFERRVLGQVLEIFDRWKPDAVCINEVHALEWLGAALRRRRQVPVLQFIHGEELGLALGGSRRYRWALQRAVREYEMFLAVSQNTRSELLRLGVDAERISLLQNGVDSARFSPGPASVELKRKHGLEKRKVLLTVARMEERKGHDVVIRAMPRILRRIPEAAYLVVGTGEREPMLRRMVAELGLTEDVVFAGKVPYEELVDYYRSCDVFLMPNRTLKNGDMEGFGLVFLEASACGKPVIGGNSGGAPDAIDSGETGLLVNGESVEEVAEAAIGILEDAELAGRMGAAGRIKAEASDWVRKACEFEGILQDVVERRRGHGGNTR